MAKGRLTGIINMVFVMMVWGSAFAVTRVIVREIPPVTFAFLRFFVASLVLLPIVLLRKGFLALKGLNRREWVILWAMAFTGVPAYYLSFNYSMVYTTASTGALIQGSIPVVIALMAVAFLHEKLSLLQVTGILLSVTGIVLIGYLAEGRSGQGHALRGNLLMIIAVLAWAAYTILSKMVTHIDAFAVTCFVTVAGTLMLFPVALALEGQSILPAIPSNGWVAVIYLGAVGSAACYFLYNISLESLKASQVGNFLNLDPIIAVIIAILFLHERINGWQIAGAALVLAGISLSSRGAGKSRPMGKD